MGAVSFLNAMRRPYRLDDGIGGLKWVKEERKIDWLARIDDVWSESGEFLERTYDDLDRYCDKRGLRVGNDPAHELAPGCITGVYREDGRDTEKDFEFYARLLYCAFKLSELYPSEFMFGWSEGGHLDNVIGYDAEDGYYNEELIIAQGSFVSFVPRIDMFEVGGQAAVEAVEWFGAYHKEWNESVHKWMKGE